MATTDLRTIMVGSTTVEQLVSAMDESNSDLAQFVLAAKDGAAVAAIVLIHGDETPAYLRAINQRKRDLDSLRPPSD